MEYFFSIIIPTYNRAHMLTKTIESVINQTFSDWELIIVDDGSTDHTKELVASFIEKDARIKYIYQENAERSAARNNGIENASGEYICFLDSDDTYLPNNLKDWYDFLKKKSFPNCFAYCDMLIDDGENTTKSILELSKINKYDFIFTNPIVPLRVCISRIFFEKHSFEKFMTVGEDVAMWLKIIQHTEIIKSDHIGVKYFVHDGNSVNPKNSYALKMYKGFKIFFRQNPILKSKISKKVFNYYISKVQTNIAKYYYRNNQKVKAILQLIKAVFRSPIHEHTKYRLRLIVLTLFSKDPNLYE